MRCASVILKETILPLVVSVVTGIAASFIATQVAISVLETKVGYIEAALNRMDKLAEQSTSNQLELARRGVWMHAKDTKNAEQDVRLNRLENRVYDGG